MKPYLLGIDIGTSACKVAVFNRNGEVLSQANGSYSVYYPKPGWAEQNPEEWWGFCIRFTDHIPIRAERFLPFYRLSLLHQDN